jgi:hypothetical protein
LTGMEGNSSDKPYGYRKTGIEQTHAALKQA